MALVLDGNGDITGLVAGALPSTVIGAGAVLQVVQATYSTTTAINSTSLTDSGLSASITPTSSSSKILVITSQPVRSYVSTGATNVYTRLLRGSTGLQSIENRYEFDAVVYSSFQLSYVFLDSPATTSSVTYKTQGRVGSSSNSANITFQQDNTPATMTLLEIAG